MTGMHTVADIRCAGETCGSVLGWKYVAAEDESQKYKVGKFILECGRVVRVSTWEDGNEDVGEAGRGGSGTKARDEEVEFDSQDEDECEDLFMGVWTPERARKRRRAKLFRRELD